MRFSLNLSIQLKMLFNFIKVNALDRTRLVTHSAADTLVVIDLCTEVLDRDGSFRTDLCTFHTADTAGLALFPCLCAFVVVFTKYGGFCGVKREQLNKMSRTGFDAHFARTAVVGIYSCNTVADKDCIILTNLDAVAEADTAVNAVFRSAEKLRCHFARMNAAVFKLFLDIAAVTLTHDGGNHRRDGACLLAHDGGNGLCNVISAGGTAVAFIRFALGKGGGIAVTAREAACAAVGTGETLSDFDCLFVNGNGKNYRSDGKAQAEYQTDTGNKQGGNKNTAHFCPSLTENVFHYARKSEEGNGHKRSCNKCYGKSSEELRNIARL